MTATINSLGLPGFTALAISETAPGAKMTRKFTVKFSCALVGGDRKERVLINDLSTQVLSVKIPSLTFAPRIPSGENGFHNVSVTGDLAIRFKDDTQNVFARALDFFTSDEVIDQTITLIKSEGDVALEAYKYSSLRFNQVDHSMLDYTDNSVQSRTLILTPAIVATAIFMPEDLVLVKDIVL